MKFDLNYQSTMKGVFRCLNTVGLLNLTALFNAFSYKIFIWQHLHSILSAYLTDCPVDAVRMALSILHSYYVDINFKILKCTTK
jgi:hypothetical protein